MLLLRDVSPQHKPAQRRQRSSLLQCGRKPSIAWRQDCASTVLYLGEINDRQQAAWRKTLNVFDEAEQRFTSMSLFPDDRELPADALDSIQVRLSGLELRRPRIS